MSEQTPPEWKNTHLGQSPPSRPAPFTRHEVVGILAGMSGCVFAVVALALWGGVVGRVVVAAVGFGVAGAVLPWIAVPAFSGGDNIAGCILGTLSVICGVVGLGVGVWFGLTSEEGLPWWAYAGSGTLAALAGGIGGGMAAGKRGG